MRKKHKKLTQADLDKMKTLYDAGVTKLSTLAKIMDMGYSTTYTVKQCGFDLEAYRLTYSKPKEKKTVFVNTKKTNNSVFEVEVVERLKRVESKLERIESKLDELLFDSYQKSGVGFRFPNGKLS